ncbi:carbonic anhydrase [Marinihelvus fidelis]|uniref:carbonic anhydrase n=2 Tax=Marinihelvus fidelis TaxID=2613842 RepID=A0A5N0T432_9GAMM|nr:carbonic anhydrase [Marinihelvus fidelis]KAA9129830.1 carbonic anhydrase [Marinihelvus fidelis]
MNIEGAAAAALEKLKQGNRRFVDGQPRVSDLASEGRRLETASGQSPFAVILGCSDSRVPAEIVFDQGLGDLFVIRVAGNVVAPSQVGSVEFAVEMFGTALVVVLGHTLCGAIDATLEQLGRDSAMRSPNLAAIVDRVRPGIEPVLASRPALHGKALAAAAVRANVHASVNGLVAGSEVLTDAVNSGRVAIVGAEYDLETGCVEFFES